MSALEYVVRPFAQPNVANTQKIVPAVPTSVAPARLKWGEVGSLPSPVSAVAAVNLSQETYTETSRNTTPITIADPANPASTLTYNQTQSMKFDKSAAANVLPSALTADIDVAFNAFSTDIKNAFQPFDPEASSGLSKVTMTFHPPG